MAISMLYGAQNLKLVNGIIAEYGGGGYWRWNWGTTLGIVKHVDAKNVTILDQSPHQLAKAKEKEPLKECRKIEGDADDLPYPTDYVDRYVFAGRNVKWRFEQWGYLSEVREEGAEAEEVTKLTPQGGVLVAGVQARVVTDGDYNRLRGNGFHQRGKATPPADT
ncbi:hypothetical protein ACFX2B_012776 [Malus domestica]